MLPFSWQLLSSLELPSSLVRPSLGAAFLAAAFFFGAAFRFPGSGLLWLGFFRCRLFFFLASDFFRLPPAASPGAFPAHEVSSHPMPREPWPTWRHRHASAPTLSTSAFGSQRGLLRLDAFRRHFLGNCLCLAYRVRRPASRALPRRPRRPGHLGVGALDRVTGDLRRSLVGGLG